MASINVSYAAVAPLESLHALHSMASVGQNQWKGTMRSDERACECCEWKEALEWV